MQPDRSRSPSPSPSPDSAPTSDEDVGSLKVKLDLLQMDAASSRTRAERGAAASCASFIDDLRGHYAPTQFGHGSSSDSTLPFYATSGTLGTVAACGSSGTGGLGGWKKGASARVSSTSNHGDSGWSSDFYSDERTQTIVAAPAPAPVPCTDFGRFRPQYEIGEGSFATVWKGVDVSNQRVVAMKYVRLRPRYRTDSEPQAELSEAQLTALLRHANVVELLDSRIILPSRTETLIYEFLPDGDLFNGLEKGDVDESECKEYMLQVADALAYIHRCGFVHNDIKLENMLLSGRTLKLCDFGLSGQIGQRRPGKPHGTTPYMAPELLVASATVQHTLTAALDIWSFGIVLYAVIFASLPWDQATERDVDFVEFVSHRDTSHCEPWSLLHPNVRGCVLAMLDVIPRNRPSAVSIGIALRGPWMEDIAIPHDDDVQLDVQQLPWPSPSPWPSRPGSPEDWQDDDLGGGAMFLEDTPMHSRDARPHSQ